MNKTLITYFSATGVTKNVANKIKDILNCDICEIEPTNIYTKEDLDWANNNSRSTIEMKDINSRPKIKNIVDVSNYDTIIIGFPIWWYKAPNIIKTFIDSVNLDNKKIFIFATSGSSSIDSSLNDLRSTYPNINIISGKRLSEVEENIILDWIK